MNLALGFLSVVLITLQVSAATRTSETSQAPSPLALRIAARFNQVFQQGLDSAQVLKLDKAVLEASNQAAQERAFAQNDATSTNDEGSTNGNQKSPLLKRTNEYLACALGTAAAQIPGLPFAAGSGHKSLVCISLKDAKIYYLGSLGLQFKSLGIGAGLFLGLGMFRSYVKSSIAGSYDCGSWFPGNYAGIVTCVDDDGEKSFTFSGAQIVGAFSEIGLQKLWVVEVPIR